MADEWIRKSGKNSAKRVLADSANAKHRFGFAGEHGSPIKSAPKLSDLWFIEYKPVSGERTYDTSRISALAKAISGISINTSTMPIDQYGKRVYVPTRIDFAEVGITMYDTVDGKMFDIAESIYSKFFKNQDAKFTGSNAEQVLTDSHAYGRKIPDDKHAYYHQHFEKITIYHFFGNLEKPKTRGPHQAVPDYVGTGSVQKIELINPLVTSITFSPSDYSTSEVRTVDLSVQPENIIIGSPDSVLFPDWMTLGMSYMLDEISPHLKRKDLDDIYPEPVYEFDNSIFRQGSKGREDGTEEWVDNLGKKRKNEFGDDEHKREQAESLTDPLRIEQQEYKDNNRKLNELMKLYNIALQETDRAGSGPAGGPLTVAQTAANNKALEEALKKNIGVIDAARQSRFKRGIEAGGNQFGTDYEATYTNPDIPTFGGIGDSNPAGTQFPRYSTDLGSSMIQELIGAFFGKRKFDVNNIKGAIVNKIIGNDGKSETKKILGSILTDGMTSSKKGAYVTTTKANPSIPTKTSVVYKTNNTDKPIGLSKALMHKYLNN